MTAGAVIGQATAAVTIAAAVVYAAGALSLGLRLWYDHYTWEPVLGQLPRNFLLVDAIIVIVPAIVLGIAAHPLYRKATKDKELTNGMSWLLAILGAAGLAGVPAAFLPFDEKTTIHGIIRPYWEIYLACLTINFVFLRLALYVLPKIRLEGLTEVLGIGLLAFAFVPAVASVAATYRFPLVTLCGKEFDRSGTVSNYAVGNLIGTDGQWVYVAEADIDHTSKGGYKLLGSYIAIIPLSAVQIESIGPEGNCGDLRGPATQGG